MAIIKITIQEFWKWDLLLSICPMERWNGYVSMFSKLASWKVGILAKKRILSRRFNAKSIEKRY
jgi:hypothetical protein